MTQQQLQAHIEQAVTQAVQEALQPALQQAVQALQPLQQEVERLHGLVVSTHNLKARANNSDKEPAAASAF